LTLGIYGLRERIVSYLNNDELSEEQRRFFDGCLKVYDAAIRFLKRASVAAGKKGNLEMSLGLAYLSENSPETLYHKMQTVFVFYMLQHNVEATYLRTLGRLDSLLYSSFIKEDEAVGIRLVKDFIKEIDTLKAPANIPFAICGTDEYGKDLTNPLSFIILDAYGELNTTNTKFHILCSKKTPDSLLRHAFEYIRAGKNSIVFMSDEAAIEGLKRLGAENNDACNRPKIFD
jgi:formate C-acetyltransferase